MEGVVYAILGGMAVAFIGQTILGWIKLSGLEIKIKDCFHHIEELQELHPRKGNPGERDNSHPHTQQLDERSS